VPGSKQFTPTQRAVALRSDSFLARIVPAAYPLLQEEGGALRKEGVRFFDLTGLFKKELGPIYVDSGCHFNARGHELMAREVAKALAAALP
jgi:lysophospholipase L1-like esterase